MCFGPRCGTSPGPSCPSLRWKPANDRPACPVPARSLIFLNTHAAPAIVLDPPSRKQTRQCSRLLSLPLDVLELIFECLLTAPEEIHLGVVNLERRLPHHWHPAHSVRPEGPGYNPLGEDCLGLIPICRHKRAGAPYGLSPNILLASRQLHVQAACVLYSRNTFAIDVNVPDTPEAAEHYDVSTLRLEQIIPFNPAYYKLLRRVTFRHYNFFMRTYPVRFFHSAMMHVLRDMPGAFTAFRRRYNVDHGGYDFETFAGWSPAATPPWFADASTSLAKSQPLITTTLCMHVDEVHSLMSTLWEGKPMHTDSRGTETHEENSCLDLCVKSDPAVYAAPWHPDKPESRHAARIVLVRLRNDNSKHVWQDDRTYKWYTGKRYLHLQKKIVGYSRGLRHSKFHSLSWDCSSASDCVWHKGPRGNKRRVFTAPLSLLLPRVCRILREEQLKREDRRRKRDGHVSVPTLPIDGMSTEDLWRRRIPDHHHIREHPQYEYVIQGQTESHLEKFLRLRASAGGN